MSELTNWCRRPIGQGFLLRALQLKAIAIAARCGNRTLVYLSDLHVLLLQAIAHGITAVLQPPATAARTPPSLLSAAPAVPTAPQAASSSSSVAAVTRSTSGRHLAAYPDMSRVFMPMNKAETDIRAKVHRMTKEQEEKWASS
jgi:hypothetical protein